MKECINQYSHNNILEDSIYLLSFSNNHPSMLFNEWSFNKLCSKLLQLTHRMIQTYMS